jgi:UDP-glucose 4-epimerase
MTAGRPRVLVTGASGYIGRLVVEGLAAEGDLEVVATDVREAGGIDGVTYEIADVRTSAISRVLLSYRPSSVVHLAAIVTPGRNADRRLLHDVDVLGTRNVIEGCIAAGTRHVVITSSGAAYGYHADSAPWLDETHVLRGNVEFAYSDHKRQVEEMLARYRNEHPELRQLIFRPGTILGSGTRNQITDLFDGRVVVGLAGTATPFVLIWDRDVVECVIRGVREKRLGIFNLAGDGVLTLEQMASMMNKPYVPLPVGLVQRVLAVMKKLGRTQYGPEQVDFLRYRPVLANTRLKVEFGYTPRKTTREVFEHFLEGRRHDLQA